MASTTVTTASAIVVTNTDGSTYSVPWAPKDLVGNFYTDLGGGIYQVKDGITLQDSQGNPIIQS